MAPMYLEHFGLAEAPFSLAPNPYYLFLGASHRDALAHLLYGVESEDGFVLLTGEVGSGKTTLSRCLLEQLPSRYGVVLIVNPQLTVFELLCSLCEQLHVAVPASDRSLKTRIDRLSSALEEAHAQGRRAVLIVDEAQNLSLEVLEQIRLLTNLETSRHKLLAVILIGQSRLGELLKRPDLQALDQRIVARCHLGPFTAAETAACVTHRLAVAGTRRALFSPAALEQLHQMSGGLPRRICILADRALLAAYTQWQERVEAKAVALAGKEIEGSAPAGLHRSLPRAAVMGLGALFGAAALSATYALRADKPATHASASAAEPHDAGRVEAP